MSGTMLLSDAVSCLHAPRESLGLTWIVTCICSLGAALALEQIAEPLGRQQELADAHLLEVAPQI